MTIYKDMVTYKIIKQHRPSESIGISYNVEGFTDKNYYQINSMNDCR